MLQNESSLTTVYIQYHEDYHMQNLTIGYQSYLKAFSASIELGSFKEAAQDNKWIEAI